MNEDLSMLGFLTFAGAMMNCSYDYDRLAKGGSKHSRQHCSKVHRNKRKAERKRRKKGRKGG